MAIEQQPFTRYHEEKKSDTFTIRLNPEERQRLEDDKQLLEQPKDSTAMKQLALIGSYVLRRPETKYILGVLFKNKRCNKRTGIVEYEV